MEEYQRMVEQVLLNSNYKPNRTASDTVSHFGYTYKIDLSEGFPLLTTKDLSGTRWESMVHEVLWYLSGEEHIRNLREHTGIWDEWAFDDGLLETAYGRFWRRYPIPEEGLNGEAWPEESHKWVNEDENTFDQIQYICDTLKEKPKSRRMVLNAWHPANAAVSKLPPCHYTCVFNVQGGDTLNAHMTQRSADIALGVPFNIAEYSMLTKVLAKQTGLKIGEFSHTLVDAHLYCGKGEHGDWYGENLEDVKDVYREGGPDSVAEYIRDESPPEPEGEEGHDHIPGLMEQLSREPYQKPDLEIADKPLDELTFDDINLKNYKSHGSIRFSVAE